MKIRILSTGEVKEVNESLGRRMTDMGYAVCEPEKAPKAVKAETAEKLPEAEEKPETVEKPAKAKKSK